MELKLILDDYSGRSGVNFLSKIEYLISDKTKLKELKERFVVYQGPNLTMMLQLVQSSSQKELNAAQKKMTSQMNS